MITAPVTFKVKVKAKDVEGHWSTLTLLAPFTLGVIIKASPGWEREKGELVMLGAIDTDYCPGDYEYLILDRDTGRIKSCCSYLGVDQVTPLPKQDYPRQLRVYCAAMLSDFDICPKLPKSLLGQSV